VLFKFIEWIRSGKLVIKVYPSQNIHAKLYIMTFKEGDRDVGRVITGSSNLTQAGLIDNLEFNVELKNRLIMNSPGINLKNYGKMQLTSVRNISRRSTQKPGLTRILFLTISTWNSYTSILKMNWTRLIIIFASLLSGKLHEMEYQEQAVLNAKKILEE